MGLRHQARPGQPEGQEFETSIIVPGLGAADHADRSALRRLFFEAYTLAAADLKRRVEATSEDAPRRVPTAEREERRSRVQARLTGLELKGELDCSNRLIDLAIEMYEEDAIRYVGPEEATKKEMELAGVKKDKTWAADAHGVVKERAVSRDQPADIASELKFSHALRRRGLAFAMADIMQYEVHELLVAKYLEALLKEPLHGYSRVTVEQVLVADRLAFRLLAEQTRTGIKRDSNAKRPCDEQVKLIVNDPDFRQALAALPATARTSPKRRADEMSGEQELGRRKKKSGSDRVRALREQVQNLRLGSGAAAASSPKGGRKGGGKGSARMPAALIGKSASLPDGRRICFAYNMSGGCAAAPSGAECPKGWHVCCEPGCGQNHSLLVHAAASL